MSWQKYTSSVGLFSLFFSAGFLLGFLFERLPTWFALWDAPPLDWDGIGAIMTFLAVCVAFLENRAYRKRERQIEHREIVEKIIQPLITDCREIISDIPQFGLGQFRWEQIKRSYFYLASRGIDRTLIGKLDSFGEEIKRYPEVIRPLIEYLNRIFFEGALFYLGARKSDDDTRAMRNISANGPDYMRSLFIATRGQKSVTFLPLIFYDVTVQEFFEINKDPAYPIFDEDTVILYYLGQATIQKEGIERVMDALREKIMNDQNHYKRLKYTRNFLTKTKALMNQLEKYSERIL